MVLTKQDYQSFREIQKDFFDYVTSRGPWSSEEIVDYLEIEYPNILPTVKEQVDALVKSKHLEVALKGLVNKVT